ncbi:MAG: type IV pilus modification protein PilV [Azoarcus sp.]|jgi:type IV pilus assembly protein PilV|nr:type IV pilus modification protein PilV [Azoarcus sp.]
MNTLFFRKPASQAGASLLEVLISVFVLAFGLLGVAGLQTSSLRNTQSALERSQAVFLTHSILDAMRASVDLSEGITIASYNTPGDTDFVTSADAPPSGCIAFASASTLAHYDLKTWLDNIALNLGADACGRISCDAATKVCTVSIRWDDSRGLEGAPEQTVATTSRL